MDLALLVERRKDRDGVISWVYPLRVSSITMIKQKNLKSKIYSTENRFCHSTKVEGLHQSCRLIQGAGECHRAFIFIIISIQLGQPADFDLIISIAPTSRPLHAESPLIVAIEACKSLTLPP